jgi:hypothetical protein
MTERALVFEKPFSSSDIGGRCRSERIGGLRWLREA